MTLVIAFTFLLFALQIADAYTTVVVLKRGGRELNPIMRYVFEAVGIEEALLLKAAVVTVIGYFVGQHTGVEYLTALVLFYLGIVLWNWGQLSK